MTGNPDFFKTFFFTLKLTLATHSPLDPHCYGLAIHTASTDLGLAISNFAGDQRCQTWALGREVSNHLHAKLLGFMPPQTWADLAFLSVAKGPGGFTGTRLGVVTARTLAQQLDLPLFGISTLAALAWQELARGAAKQDMTGQADSPEPLSSLAPTNPAPTDIAVQMLAQRGDIYGAIYGLDGNGSLTALMPDAVMSLQRWQQLLSDWNRSYRLVWAEAELGATAESVLELAYHDWRLGLRAHWSEALPFYGQSPV